MVGQNISSLNSNSIWFSPSDTSSIEFTYDLNGSCEFKDTVEVKVIHLPTSLISPSTMDLCDDDSVNISINYNGSYLWNNVSGEQIISGSNLECDTCSTIWASPDSNATWSITYTKIPGCSVSDTISFVHNYLTPPGLPPSATICEGDTLSFTSSSIGFNSWSYSNITALVGVNISSTSGNSTSVYPATNTQLVYFNSVGMCSQLDTVQINVQNLQADLGLTNAIAICSGDTANITSSANASIALRRGKVRRYTSDICL